MPGRALNEKSVRKGDGRRKKRFNCFAFGFAIISYVAAAAPAENAEWRNECCMHCTVCAHSIQKNLNIQIQRNVIALGHVKTITKSLESIEKRVEQKQKWKFISSDFPFITHFMLNGSTGKRTTMGWKQSFNGESASATASGRVCVLDRRHWSF